MTQDTGEGTGNNIYQAGKDATYHQEALQKGEGGE